jgi:transcriptional regulator with XRE-family HTH domain
MSPAIIRAVKQRPAGALVRQARGISGLTQRGLAQRAHDHQPNVAAIESGERDAFLGTVDRLVSAAGGHLCVLPTTASTVAEVAEEIRRLLDTGNERHAFRTWLGLHDDLLGSEPATRVALCVTPPPPVKDDRYDALLAAVVEHDLEKDGLPVPGWATDERRHGHGWFVDDIPALSGAIQAATPAAFVRHGIWLDARELDSV